MASSPMCRSRPSAIRAERATALVYFGALSEAGRAVAPLAEAGAAALEIMDSASLLSMASELTHPVEIGPHSAALLIEFQEDTDAALSAGVERATRVLGRIDGIANTSFSTDPKERALKWKMRKGLLPLIGARRGPGMAILNEDVAFPRERLAEVITDLHALFARFGVRDAVVFGHARDGNLHFIAPQDFRGEKNVANYAAFMDALAELVVGKYDGALKAEHGAGRNMAPYVEREWGAAAYAILREVKTLFDPYNILNPGVLLSDDKAEHVTNLKPFTEITATADRCIECGYCEPVCPTRASGLSPRQRIILLREMTEIAQAGESLPDGLAADYALSARRSCVRDSMCITACPVKIDTGLLMKELDHAEATFIGRGLAGFAASNFAGASAMARRALSVAGTLAASNHATRGLLRGGSAVLNALAPALFPKLDAKVPLPLPAPGVPKPRGEGVREVVYFPSCVSRIFGAMPGEAPLSTMEATLRCLEAAGYRVAIPEGIESLVLRPRFLEQVAAGSGGRRDERHSSRPHEAHAGRRVARGHRRIALRPGLPRTRRRPAPRLRLRAVLVARSAHSQRRAAWCPSRPGGPPPHLLPDQTGRGPRPQSGRVGALGGSAGPPARELLRLRGNQGFVHPEITEAATRAEAEDVRALIGAGGSEVTAYSTCRTCEIGMSRATGASYTSAAHLVYRALRLGESR